MSTQIDNNVITTISMPIKLYEEFEKYCEENGFNKSEFIRKLVRDELAKET